MATKKKTTAKKSVKAKTKSKIKATKKSSVKKTAPKKKTSVKKAASKKISPQVKKLAALCAELTKDEIDFLISQAQKLKRNHDLISEQQQRAEGHKMVVEAMNPVKDKETIKIIEGEDGSHFIIVLGNERNFFDREEMKKIVKICQLASGKADGMTRLYTWFDRFRSDVLNNNDIGGTTDQALATMYKKIINTYTTS